MTTTKTKNRFLLFVAAGAIVSAMALTLGGAGDTPANNEPIIWTKSPASQLVFFAVLEGLYRDGVKNDDVDVIVPPGQHGRPKFDNDNFVYACPLCHPAYEAFCLYSQRQEFYGLKLPVDAFGKGLDPAISARLHNQNVDERRKAIQELINRWVSQRLEMMRQTDAEREAITREMEQGRKQGMGSLKRLVQVGQAIQARTNCPICDGSFGACTRRLTR